MLRGKGGRACGHEKVRPVIPAHTLRNGGLSRRGFLRALGVTACAALVPGLAQAFPVHRSGTQYIGCVMSSGDPHFKGPTRITLEDIIKAKNILEANETHYLYAPDYLS